MRVTHSRWRVARRPMLPSPSFPPHTISGPRFFRLSSSKTLDIDKKIPFTVVSPSNHFVFTPLLASTAVGTLEFRCIQEPIRTHLGPKGGFLQAKARTLDPVRKTIVCESVDSDLFEIAYDKLVIAVGVKTNTFGIESIKQAELDGDGVFFLKRLAHARAIRTNIVACFEKAALPHVTEAERRRLLSFVVVGGGPTSCEFTAELHGASLPWVLLFCIYVPPCAAGPAFVSHVKNVSFFCQTL
jgi:NADH dehydrogenase FAD-containing subunit